MQGYALSHEFEFHFIDLLFWLSIKWDTKNFKQYFVDIKFNQITYIYHHGRIAKWNCLGKINSKFMQKWMQIASKFIPHWIGIHIKSYYIIP